MKEALNSGMESSENKREFFRRQIEQYYSLVDAEDFGSLFELFTDDIDYNRAGEPIEGMDALKKFYTKDRELKEVKHLIESIIVEGNETAVRGVVSFKDENNEQKSEDFADFFVFNDDGKIKERKTYLAKGYELNEKELEEADYSPESTIIEGNKKAVRGVVSFKDEKDENKSVGYADFFVFDENGKTKERKTYLLQGYESVE